MTRTNIKPREFSRDQLVKLLHNKGRLLVRQLFRTETNLSFLIKESVDRSTFRVFHNVSPAPSKVFRDWASSRLSSNWFTLLARSKSTNEDCAVIGHNHRFK
jgi:hypothetical protein